MPKVPATGAAWIAAAVAGALLVGAAVDPLLGGTPWWSYPQPGDLWAALLPPLAIWLAVQAVSAWLLRRAPGGGRVPLGRIGWVWATSLIVWLPWSLLLHDAFPGSRGSFLGYGLAALGAALLVWSLVRPARRSSPSPSAPAPRATPSTTTSTASSAPTR